MEVRVRVRETAVSIERPRKERGLAMCVCVCVCMRPMRVGHRGRGGIRRRRGFGARCPPHLLPCMQRQVVAGKERVRSKEELPAHEDLRMGLPHLAQLTRRGARAHLRTGRCGLAGRVDGVHGRGGV